MGKFISIPTAGGMTTLGSYSITTVTNGVASGITVGAAAVAHTFVPQVVVTTTDGQGSGLVVSASTLAGGVPTLTVVNGGSGYTSTSTIILTLVPPSLFLNADQIMSIAPVATGSATASNATVVIRFNTAATPTLTLTLGNALNSGTFNSDGAFAVKNAIINAIMESTNVKRVDQVTPVVLPSNCLINQYLYS